MWSTGGRPSRDGDLRSTESDLVTDDPEHPVYGQGRRSVARHVWGRADGIQHQRAVACDDAVDPPRQDLRSEEATDHRGQHARHVGNDPPRVEALDQAPEHVDVDEGEPLQRPDVGEPDGACPAAEKWRTGLAGRPATPHKSRS
jgi:hypothetical protein